MANIVVPPLSESVVEATVSEWLVKAGDTVVVGDVLVVLETDKVALEVAAEEGGTITGIMAQEGDDVTAGQVLATLQSGAAPVVDAVVEKVAEAAPLAVADAPARKDESVKATPVAQRMASDLGIDLEKVKTSNGGKIDKADIQAYMQSQGAAPALKAPAAAAPVAGTAEPRALDPREQRSKMSRRRRTIAHHLVVAQATAAMLTTFNEVDMSAVMDLRARRKDAFKEKYGISLGINSFFVKAAIGALKAFPRLNAEIDGDYIISKSYYDIGVAVGSEEGLVVPVLRDADRLSFAEIESQIKAYAGQVRDNSLPLEALRGGTFTITNGGVFGSMLSTPILNYPQVAILGLHAIKDRAVVVNGEVAVRPVMYTALTYDHRIVDGRDAVQFLVKIKDLIEDPEALLIEG